MKFGGGSICINIDQQTLTGEASCEPAFLGGGSIAGSFTAGRNGLRDIALVGDDLGIPIGTTPAMLQKIGASLENIHLNPGWSVTGNLGVSVGKKKIADNQGNNVPGSKTALGAAASMAFCFITFRNSSNVSTSLCSINSVLKYNIIICTI